MKALIDDVKVLRPTLHKRGIVTLSLAGDADELKTVFDHILKTLHEITVDGFVQELHGRDSLHAEPETPGNKNPLSEPYNLSSKEAFLILDGQVEINIMHYYDGKDQSINLKLFPGDAVVIPPGLSRFLSLSPLASAVHRVAAPVFEPIRGEQRARTNSMLTAGIQATSTSNEPTPSSMPPRKRARANSEHVPTTPRPSISTPTFGARAPGSAPIPTSTLAAPASTHHLAAPLTSHAPATRLGPSIQVSTHPDLRDIIVELCQQFYDLGWVTGTGGGISIRDRTSGVVYIAPSGVQKERIHRDEIFQLDMEKNVLVDAKSQNPKIKLKPSACTPLFFSAYDMRDAGACIHTHSIHAMLLTKILHDKDEFVITKQEMIKGIVGHGYNSTLTIPIIENTPHEEHLTDSLQAAIAKYPDVPAVLVRDHGVYVWGDTWWKAKTQCECLDYLFKAAVKMHKLGISFS